MTSAEADEAVEAIFAPDGPLARAMPDFEPRAGQIEMAAAVAQVFARGGVLLAEAGTGTGKTLAYLVPAILSRERVLISTGTKNLQEQIYFKDIPALRDALGIPFTATCMKGRANYVCLHKLDQLHDGAGPAVHDVFLPIIREWSARTETGDRAELRDLPEDLVVLERGLGDRRHVSRHRVSALRRLFRHPDAPARRRIRRRHRQPPPAVRGRVRSPERVRRGHPLLQPRDHRRSASARGRRHAVLRLQRQQLPVRGARARRPEGRRLGDHRRPGRQGGDRQSGRPSAQSRARRSSTRSPSRIAATGV